MGSLVHLIGVGVGADPKKGGNAPTPMGSLVHLIGVGVGADPQKGGNAPTPMGSLVHSLVSVIGVGVIGDWCWWEMHQHQ